MFGLGRGQEKDLMGSRICPNWGGGEALTGPFL
jgi:hypothetical protein